jgi:hypothetical protein
MVCQRFLEPAKLPQTAVFLRRSFSQAFRRFTRVAARLLHKLAGMSRSRQRHGWPKDASDTRGATKPLQAASWAPRLWQVRDLHQRRSSGQRLAAYSASWVRSLRPSLRSIFETLFLAVPSLMYSLPAISALVAPRRPSRVLRSYRAIRRPAQGPGGAVGAGRRRTGGPLLRTCAVGSPGPSAAGTEQRRPHAAREAATPHG